MFYRATYKCPLCGAIIKYGNPTECKESQLPDLLARVVKNQQFIGTTFYTAPLSIPHKCNDGNAGLAQFIGFVKER